MRYKIQGISSVLTLFVAAAGWAAPVAQPWLDATLSPDRRAELLNRELTLEERIALVHGPMALPLPNKPLPAEAIIAAGYIPGIPRLGIPALFETDASLGVTNPLRLRPGDGATALPSGLALAASFNPQLAFDGGAMIGSEARAKGFNVLLGPGANLARDPRNGRNFEYLGEDPLLAGTLAGEMIRGIQGNHVVATLKHFALNDQETRRHSVNALIEPAALRESDLLAFQIAIERGQPGSVMCSYNLVNGHYGCGNDFLLNKVLKQDWLYPGWVMSDWGAVYATQFASLGLDQQSGEQLDKQVWFGAPLKQAVEAGTVSEKRLADMTRRILRSMFTNGLFEHPPAKAAAIDYAAHTQVAREAASQGIVLLRNALKALPMSPSLKRILVVGGHADLGVLSGGGSSQVFKPSTPPGSVIPVGGEGDMAVWRNMVFQSSAPLAAIRARAPNAQVVFDEGRYPSAAAMRARDADAVIVFANQWMMEDQDAPDMTLPEGQDALIAAVAAANPHTIVVLQTGGAIAMPWLDKTAAVVAAWYSGAGGADAIADVLFGQVNPSGRLPVTFPSSIDQYPRPQIPGWGLTGNDKIDAPHEEGAAVGYRWMAQRGQAPLLPFGFGLSYTDFEYRDLQVAGGSTLTLRFDIKNVGGRAGADVPQAYLVSAAGSKVMRLVGFRRTALAPGETQHVELRVDPRLLANFDERTQRWRVMAGEYKVAIGKSSGELVLTGSTRVASATIKP